ncbi:membrane protein YczE [Haloactinospora alba]|uniref:membrane protein YczE n=1 Tax=Haloactinospora alba TaxID=405555 RepID=UPI0011506415|nr:hypothetical protein [Haloactinospora alba]
MVKRVGSRTRRFLPTPLLPPPRPRRLAQLYTGLYLYGLGCALLIVADLGAMPWDVLHQGLALHTGLSVGAANVAVAAVLMVLWIPLRQRPGLGTVSNALLVGASVDLTLLWLPEADGILARSACMVAGVLVVAGATGCYVGAQLGPGPRDGLMTGIAALGTSIRTARTCVEIAVVVAGSLLGGTVGVGTLVFALAIGPLAQVFLSAMTIRSPDSTTR